MRWVFEITDIREEGQDYTWEGAGTSLTQAGDELVFQEALKINLRLAKNKEQVRVEGQLSALLEIACCRCLKKYPLAVNENIFALFIPQQVSSPEEEQELGADELNINYYTGDTIDLTEVLRDQLLLSIPITPRCREECRGLCPRCGQDLNEGSCECSRESKDSPFAALKSLKNLKL